MCILKRTILESIESVCVCENKRTQRVLVNGIIASEVNLMFMLEYHMVPCLVHYDFNKSRLFLILSMCGSRGGDRGSGPLLKNHKNIGFLV